MNCPHCKAPMRLLRGEKFWTHATDKRIKCPITSVPNDPRIVALHTPKGGDDVNNNTNN